MSKRGYVLHAYSGFENQVRRSLEDRVQRSALQDRFGQALWPTEEEIELGHGRKRSSERKYLSV